MSACSFIVKPTSTNKYFLILNTQDCFTCSFTEFLPFTSALYYFSTFKAFKQMSAAGQ